MVVPKKIVRLCISGNNPIAFRQGLNPWVLHGGGGDTHHSLYLDNTELLAIQQVLANQGLRGVVLDISVDKPHGRVMPCPACFTCPWLSDIGVCGVPDVGPSPNEDPDLIKAAEACPLIGAPYVRNS